MSFPQIDAQAVAGVRRPILSVMIPTRDPSWHLDVALRSVLAQSPRPTGAQTAVVDDGSEPTIQLLHQDGCVLPGFYARMRAALGRAPMQLAPDREMWVRIAVRYLVWGDVRALAAYRRHPGSQTGRLRQEGAAWRDICHAIRTKSASETLLEMIASPRIRAALVKLMELTHRVTVSHGTFRSEACAT